MKIKSYLTLGVLEIMSLFTPLCICYSINHKTRNQICNRQLISLIAMYCDVTVLKHVLCCVVFLCCLIAHLLNFLYSLIILIIYNFHLFFVSFFIFYNLFLANLFFNFYSLFYFEVFHCLVNYYLFNFHLFMFLFVIYIYIYTYIYTYIYI